MKRSLFFWIGCATLLSTNCKTNNANLKERNQDFAATNDQFENDPYGLNDIKNFAIDFDSLAKAEWEGDIDSGITGKWSKSLKQLKDSDFAKMKAIFCGTEAGCDDFDKTYALFFANSALPSPENPSPEANWVGDQMFTKAINAKGEHVRVRPYIRAIPYDPYNEANPQKSASRLKEVMRPGDIIVFWHPEMNDFGEMVRRGDAEYAMKEMVKFRSTHAGLAWYDGDKIWSVNSPQGYHKGWFDETSKYPFHIFRIVPNSKGSVKFSISDKEMNKKISTVNYGCAKPPCSYTKRDAIVEYFSLYALGMSNYFDFPGDYNGGDPLNLFHTSLIDSYHNTWTSDNFLPGMDGIRFSGGEYSSVRGSEQNMAQIYCAEFVWMAGAMALSKKLPSDFAATEYMNQSFPQQQYTDLGVPSVPNFGKIGELYKGIGAESWVKEPSFLYKPYTLWDVIEAFLATYYQNPPRPEGLSARSVRAMMLAQLKPSILKNLGVQSRHVKPVDPNKIGSTYCSDQKCIVDNPSEFLEKMKSLGKVSKSGALNFLFDAILFTLGTAPDRDDPKTEARKALLKQVSEGLMEVSNKRKTQIPVRFVPPHSYTVEANKLDSNLVYVASAFPSAIFQKNRVARKINLAVSGIADLPKVNGLESELLDRPSPSHKSAVTLSETQDEEMDRETENKKSLPKPQDRRRSRR